MNIYESGAGDALLNPTVHTGAIKDYLEAERAFILRCLPGYDAVVEAGCSTGRHADDVIKNDKQYIGIDRVSRYLSEGAHHYPQAIFVAADVAEIDVIVSQYLTEPAKALIVVPFNLLGTLAAPESFLQRLFATGHHFLLFSFTTDDVATWARREYYLTSGFKDLHQRKSDDGVLFTSNTGLHSFAYSGAWFARQFEQAGAHLHKNPVGTIGAVYSNF